jgi:large subunit ribosomal protein L37Ae
LGSTKKVKSAGKFGAKFGIGIRKRWLKVAEKQRKRYDCPSCGFTKVKRLATGVFQCQKCDLKFAGGAYFPTTLTGGIVNKMIEQKQFLPAMTELIAATEKAKGLAGEETESKTGSITADNQAKEEKPKKSKKAEASE